jgi:hypothetical protein
MPRKKTSAKSASRKKKVAARKPTRRKKGPSTGPAARIHQGVGFGTGEVEIIIAER